jgi:hypothetical protein
MTIQPYYTHAERYAAQGVYNQLKNKEKTIGLSPHEIGERDIMRERLRLPVPERDGLWAEISKSENRVMVLPQQFDALKLGKPVEYWKPERKETNENRNTPSQDMEYDKRQDDVHQHNEFDPAFHGLLHAVVTRTYSGDREEV